MVQRVHQEKVDCRVLLVLLDYSECSALLESWVALALLGSLDPRERQVHVGSMVQ